MCFLMYSANFPPRHRGVQLMQLFAVGFNFCNECAHRTGINVSSALVYGCLACMKR